MCIVAATRFLTCCLVRTEAAFSLLTLLTCLAVFFQYLLTFSPLAGTDVAGAQQAIQQIVSSSGMFDVCVCVFFFSILFSLFLH